jgi:hypothetical protein
LLVIKITSTKEVTQKALKELFNPMDENHIDNDRQLYAMTYSANGMQKIILTDLNTSVQVQPFHFIIMRFDSELVTEYTDKMTRIIKQQFEICNQQNTVEKQVQG